MVSTCTRSRTVLASCLASMGLARYVEKPLSSAVCRSSDRANAVTAIEAIRLPDARTRRISSYPSSDAGFAFRPFDLGHHCAVRDGAAVVGESVLVGLDHGRITKNGFQSVFRLAWGNHLPPFVALHFGEREAVRDSQCRAVLCGDGQADEDDAGSKRKTADVSGRLWPLLSNARFEFVTPDATTRLIPGGRVAVYSVGVFTPTEISRASACLRQ